MLSMSRKNPFFREKMIVFNITYCRITGIDDKIKKQYMYRGDIFYEAGKKRKSGIFKGDNKGLF